MQEPKKNDKNLRSQKRCKGVQKILIEYCTTKSNCLNEKLFEQSQSTGTIPIFWQYILASIKPDSL